MQRFGGGVAPGVGSGTQSRPGTAASPTGALMHPMEMLQARGPAIASAAVPSRREMWASPTHRGVGGSMPLAASPPPQQQGVPIRRPSASQLLANVSALNRRFNAPENGDSPA